MTNNNQRKIKQRQIRQRQLRRKRKLILYRRIAVLLGVVLLLILMISLLVKRCGKSEEEDNKEVKEEVQEEVQEETTSESLTFEELMEKTAQENNFSTDEYPEKLIELVKKNPETQDFVVNYPMKKDTYSEENLTELDGADGVPLLFQWDERWGYYQYGGNVMGLAGCGPTCLSMVASYLLDNPALTPIYMADFATENGHSIDGGGTAWSLMNQGAKDLGLNPKEVPLDENAIKGHLENGRPIICNVGEGIFTDNGHYLVFSGWVDGKIKINDPNRREFSERLWSYEEIKDQIKNMWVY